MVFYAIYHATGYTNITLQGLQRVVTITCLKYRQYDSLNVFVLHQPTNTQNMSIN